MSDVLSEDIDPRSLGNRLRDARIARGLTQQAVGELLKLARTTIVAIESGERRVKPVELMELASIYGRKLSELLRPKGSTGSLAVQLRSALATQKTEMEEELFPAIAEFQRLCEDYLYLEKLCAAPLNRRYPTSYDISGVSPEVAGEDVAAAERNRLGLGDGPFLNVREAVESDVGLRIFFPLLPSRVAGMFAFSEELGACMAINRNHPPERQRMSCAHEYGHFLTDRYRTEITFQGQYERRPRGERFAEGFARAFLMPAEGLRRRFLELKRERKMGFTPADLCRLSHFYFVSVEAMTRRLEEIQLIPARVGDNLRQQGFQVREAQALFGLGEHVNDASLLPARFRYLAIEAWRAGDLSEGQVASLLRVDRLEARRLAQALLSDVEQVDSVQRFDLGKPLVAYES